MECDEYVSNRSGVVVHPAMEDVFDETPALQAHASRGLYGADGVRNMAAGIKGAVGWALHNRYARSGIATMVSHLGHPHHYLPFVAPALAALGIGITAQQVNEAPVFRELNYVNTLFLDYSTPLSVLLVGEAHSHGANHDHTDYGHADGAHHVGTLEETVHLHSPHAHGDELGLVFYNPVPSTHQMDVIEETTHVDPVPEPSSHKHSSHEEHSDLVHYVAHGIAFVGQSAVVFGGSLGLQFAWSGLGLPPLFGRRREEDERNQANH